MSCISLRQYFNRRFTVVYVPFGSTKTWLCAEGKSVMFEGKITRSSDNIAHISSGWLQFATAFGLKVGDVCAIRLTQYGGRIRVDVHVIFTTSYDRQAWGTLQPPLPTWCCFLALGLQYGLMDVSRRLLSQFKVVFVDGGIHYCKVHKLVECNSAKQ
jgi:hypothetical protein